MLSILCKNKNMKKAVSSVNQVWYICFNSVHTLFHNCRVVNVSRWSCLEQRKQKNIEVLLIEKFFPLIISQSMLNNVLHYMTLIWNNLCNCTSTCITPQYNVFVLGSENICISTTLVIMVLRQLTKIWRKKISK